MTLRALRFVCMCAFGALVCGEKNDGEREYDKDFSFNETNEFNYTFPNYGNWTYVPCEHNSLDIWQCRRFTGNTPVYCSKFKPEGFDHVISFCRCVEVPGLTSKYCSDPKDVHPRCVSGPEACHGPLLVQGYLVIVLFFGLSVYTVYSMYHMHVRIKRVKRSGKLMTAMGTSLLFAFFALFMCWCQASIWALTPIVKTDLYISVFIGLAPMFAVAALCNIAFMWITVVNRAKKLQHSSGKNISNSAKRFILFYGVFAAPSSGILFGMGHYNLAALSGLITVLGLGLIFLSGARKIRKMLASTGFSQANIVQPIEAAASSIYRYVFLYTLAMIAYVNVPSSQSMLFNSLTNICAWFNVSSLFSSFAVSIVSCSQCSSFLM